MQNRVEVNQLMKRKQTLKQFLATGNLIQLPHE
jgi:hypothetical protein